MTKDKIKSHVYIPRFVLKYFGSGDAKNINYINGDYKIIKRSSPKLFNAEKGFFDEQSEGVFNKFSENVLASFLVKAVNELNNDSFFNSLNLENIDVIRRFLAYQLYREETLIEAIRKKAFPKLDIKTVRNMVVSNEPNFNISFNVVKSLNLSFVISPDDASFVLPQTCFVSLGNLVNSNDFIILLVLHPKLSCAFYVEEKGMTMPRIIKLNKEKVLFLNEEIFYTAKKAKHFIVGNAEELERLIDLS